MKVDLRNVDHPLLHKLHALAARVDVLFPDRFNPGFGPLGLMLANPLDDFRYGHITPLNCTVFAWTGGEGVHFSLMWVDGVVRENSPVMITIPCGGWNTIVGEDLFDFLCCGAQRGYFALEQLAYGSDLVEEVYTSRDWMPSEDWHYSVDFNTSKRKDLLLSFLKSELGIQPWTDRERFAKLRDRFQNQIAWPNE